MSNTNPSFNMDYFNQNMNNNKKNTGSTYNFIKKKVEPFKSLIKFDNQKIYILLFNLNVIYFIFIS